MLDYIISNWPSSIIIQGFSVSHLHQPYPGWHHQLPRCLGKIARRPPGVVAGPPRPALGAAACRGATAGGRGHAAAGGAEGVAARGRRRRGRRDWSFGWKTVENLEK